MRAVPVSAWGRNRLVQDVEMVLLCGVHGGASDQLFRAVRRLDGGFLQTARRCY